MFFYIIHDFRLLIADIECPGGSVTWRCEVGVGSFFRSVHIADGFVEDKPSLSAHELQHEDEQQYFSIYFSVLSFYDPPHFLIIHVKKLLH